MIANATIHLLHSFFRQADVQSPHTWLVIPSKDSSKSALEWHSMTWFFDKLINFTLKSPHWFYWLLCYLLLVFTCCWTSSRLSQHEEADVTSGTASNILRFPPSQLWAQNLSIPLYTLFHWASQSVIDFEIANIEHWKLWKLKLSKWLVLLY